MKKYVFFYKIYKKKHIFSYNININMGVIVYCISKVLYSIRSVLLYHIVYFFATYCTYCIFWPRYNECLHYKYTTVLCLFHEV